MRTSALKLLRLSLRELLALVVLLSLVFAGAVTGSGWPLAVLRLAAAVVVMFALMQALFARGRPRVHATGLLIAAMSFWVTMHVLNPAHKAFHRWTQQTYISELDWGVSPLALATVSLLAREEVYDQDTDTWVNADTEVGQRLINNPPQNSGNFGGGFGVQTRNVPSYTQLVALFQPAGLLLFGWLGGRFALFAFDHRLSESRSSGDA